MYASAHQGPAAPPTERAGVGLALVGAGIVVGLLSLLVLPWTEVDGGTFSFLDIRDAVSEAADPTEVVPDVAWYYLEWAAFATFAVTVLLAALAAIGLRSGATRVVRTLAVVAALGACVVHYIGVWQLFVDDGDPAFGTLVLYAAYALMLAGAAVGPRTLAPASAPWPPVRPDAPTRPGPGPGAPGRTAGRGDAAPPPVPPRSTLPPPPGGPPPGRTMPRARPPGHVKGPPPGR
ncbi:MAG TPA: hypothetical protein VFI47_11535 [Acidimicrobiales bacterium]|nr:hypothetical protein [Acidimicrobiales bacterium]